GHGERLLGSDAKRTANSESGASREFSKEFPAVRVQAVPRANNEVLNEVRRPGDADARLENPLPPGERGTVAGAEYRLGRAELLVVGGDNETDVVDCIRRKTVGIVLWVKIREKTIFF